MAFAGRSAELALLQSRFADALDGRSGAVLLEGAPASGRTALLHRFTSQLTTARVVWATGDHHETGFGFAFLDHVRAQLADSVGAEAGADAESDTETSARVPGSIPALHREVSVEGAGLAELMTAASRDAPLVLVLDDLDLADTPSLNVISFALRRVTTCRVLVVLTVCSGRPPRGGTNLWRWLDSHGARVVLGGLSTGEVQELGTATGLGRVTHRAARRLREHAGDNTLHLRSLMTELSLAEINNMAVPLPAPKSFALLVLAKLAGLDSDTRRLAAAAAVLGVESTVAHAARLAGLDAPLEAMQGLRDAGFADFSVDLRGAVLTFAHPIIRAAIHDGLGPLYRSELHGRAVALSTGTEALRHRVAAAMSPDAELVDELTRQAAAAAATGEWRRAADLLRAAVRLCAPGAVRDGLIVDVAELLLRDGDLVGAAPYLRLTEDLPATAQLLQVRGRSAWLGGRFAAAESLARQAWEQLGDTSSTSRDQLAAMIAQLCILRGDGAAATDWAAAALGSGSLPEDLAPTTIATAAIGAALTGRSGEAADSLRRHAARSTTPPHPYIRAARGILALWAGDLAAARADLGAGRGATDGGTEPYELVALGYLVDAEFRSGDWERAEHLGDQLVGLVDDSGQTWLRAFAHAMASLVPAARGQWESAARHVESAAWAAAELGDQPSRAIAANAAVHLAACRGEAAAVVAAAQWLLSEPGAHSEPGLFSWPLEYAGALVNLGRLDEAEAWLDRLTEIAHQRGHRPVLAAAARVRGELACVRRQTSAARAAFETAVHGTDHGRGLEIGRAHAAYGRFLRRRGERRAAAQRLTQALAVFADLGAEPFVRITEPELRACGGPDQRKSTGRVAEDGPRVADLTAQELVVAELVAMGRTNRQVAEQLVLSVKTVDYHLGHVYQKLGVQTRTQLAGLLTPHLDGSRTR